MMIKDLTKIKSRDKKGNIVIEEGDIVRWKTLKQKLYVGIVREITNNIAIVKTMKGVMSIEL